MTAAQLPPEEGDVIIELSRPGQGADFNNPRIRQFRYILNARDWEKNTLLDVSLSRKERDWHNDTIAAASLPLCLASGIFGIYWVNTVTSELAQTGALILILISALCGCTVVERAGRAWRHNAAIEQATAQRKIISLACIDSQLISTSLAMNILLTDPSFGRQLTRTLLSHIIRQSTDVNEYIHYAKDNPNDELYPKLLVVLDTYLTTFSANDEWLDEAAYEKLDTHSRACIKEMKAIASHYAIWQR